MGDMLTSDLVTQMVWRMTRQMDGCGSQLANRERLIIFKQLIKNTTPLLLRNSIPLSKKLLDLLNALPNANGRFKALYLRKSTLQVRRRCQMICMCMRLQDPVNLVPFFLDEREQSIGGDGGYGLRCGVVV